MSGHEAREKIDAVTDNLEGADAPQQTSEARNNGSSLKGGVALCFSGGGIRSATFNLGVLQELAKNGWLKNVDYLSTVSGGGYIGAWFVAQIARVRDQNLRPSATEEKLDQREPDSGNESAVAAADVYEVSKNATEDVLNVLAGAESSIKSPGEPKDASLRTVEEAVGWLRSYSNYLSPTWGLSKDALTLAAIYLRNLAIHWMILLPLLIAVLLAPRVVHLVVLNPNPYLNSLFWLTTIFAVLMGAFSTNGPPAQGERRSGRVNLMWHLVCFVLPLVVIPICLTAMTGNKALNHLATLSWSTVTHFALAGAALYLLGSVLVLLFRAPLALVPDVQSHGDRIWVVSLNRLLRVEAGVSTSRNFSAWVRRFPIRALLNVVTGAFAGGLCGLSFAIACAAPVRGELTTALTPVLFVFSIWFASVLRVAIATRLSNEASREWWARATGGSLVGIVLWVVVSLLVLWLPLAILELSVLRTGWAAGAAGLGGLLFAAGTSAIGYWSKHGAELSKKATHWHDRLGKAVIEIAALLTLVGATLILNLVIAYGVLFLAHGAHPAPLGGMNPDGMVYACASSARAEVEGASVSARRSVPCSLGALLIQDMPTHGFSKEDIENARNRYAACCVMGSKEERLASNEELCPPNQNAPQDDDTKAKEPGMPLVVDMLCPLPSAPKNADGGANSLKEESGADQDAKPPKIFSVSADLPIPLRMTKDYRDSLQHTNEPTLLFLILVMVLVSLAMSGFAGVDTYSLQAMYANRLTRAYLGASNRDGSKADAFTDFNSGDDMPLHELRGIRPELVINAALNLTKVERKTLAWQQRKACAFTMSPDRCSAGQGNSVDTMTYQVGAQPLTLGQAISISGAAVSPNMGYHSSPAMAAVLTLFNLRLGRWMPNPGLPSGRRRLGSFDALLSILHELLSNVSDGGKLIYVSDGGHFENLGVYAMLQRQCHLVVAVDAGADPDFEFEDLENLIRKARVDLGVEIRMTNVESCTADIKSGKIRYLHGSIEYPDGYRGELIILKPVMCGDEPYDVTQYAKSVSKRGSIFPQQTTADQFFDEAQFESYRMLGRHTVRNVFDENGVPPGPPAIVAKGGDVPNNTGGGTTPPIPSPPDEPKPWLIGSAADAAKSLGSMGQAALLASAITLTGVIGVSGVVSLKESTLSLDPESMRQLQSLGGGSILSDAALKEVTSSGMVQVDVSDPRLGLEEEIKNLDWKMIAESETFKSVLDQFAASLASVELNVRMVGTNGTKSNSDDLKKILESLDDSVKRLEESSRNLSSATGRIEPGSKILNQSISDLRGAVNDFKIAVEKGSSSEIVSSLKNINETLGKVDGKLGQIKEAVEEASPRNTIRGAK
jgi:hypothetical protein